MELRQLLGAIPKKFLPFRELLAFKDPVPYYKEGTDSAKCMLTGDLPVTSEESVNQVPLFCQFDTAEES